MISVPQFIFIRLITYNTTHNATHYSISTMFIMLLSFQYPIFICISIIFFQCYSSSHFYSMWNINRPYIFRAILFLYLSLFWPFLAFLFFVLCWILYSSRWKMYMTGKKGNERRIIHCEWIVQIHVNLINLLFYIDHILTSLSVRIEFINVFIFCHVFFHVVLTSSFLSLSLFKIDFKYLHR